MGAPRPKAVLAPPEQSLGRRHNDASQVGLTQPHTPRYLFLRRKRYQKAAGGGPPVPPASPSWRYFIYCLFALCCSWIDSTGGARPSSAALQRVPTGSNGGYAKTAVRANPAAGSTPLRGRQAELFKYQSARSEPRRKPLFTGHRSSPPGSVSVNPPPRQAAPMGRPRAGFLGAEPLSGLLVTFPPREK